MFGAEDAGAFTEFLDRADARAGGAEEIRREDDLRRAAQVSRGYLFDKRRDIDMGRARMCARRVKTVEAPVRFDGGGVFGERRQVLAQRRARSA